MTITKSLQEALNNVTYESASTISPGNEVKLNDEYILYFYEGGESLVIVRESDWTEVLWIQYNSETGGIEYGEI